MKTDDYSVWVAGGTLLLIAPNVPASQRQAVLDSLLYTQLVANKAEGSRFTCYPQWYGRYRRALSERGWILTQLFQDSQTAKDTAMLAPIQPLSLWLATRCEGATSIIDQSLDILVKTPTGADSFRRFTCEGDVRGARVALEIGLVRPGPVIDLCSVAFQTSQPLEQVTIEHPLSADTLLGELFVKGLSAHLDGELFEPHRVELRKLIERKQQEHCYLLELGKTQGCDHG